MGRAAFIFVLGSIGLFVIINFNMNNSLVNEAQSAFDYYKESTARNIANSTVEMVLSQVADTTTYRSTSLVQMNLFGGTAAYTVIDTTISSQSYIRIRARGSYEGITKTSVVLAQIPSSGFIPITVKAAISTNNNVETNGTLTVDGRDHDLNGNLIAGQGTLGIWSTQDIAQNGSSIIGGTSSGTDYQPNKPADAGTTASNSTYAGGYPNTPDSVLGGSAKGFPEGTLKSIAQSGMYGSQYTTNPSFLSFPLKGVTYVELPSGSIWTSSNINGTGILVIHNSTTNAVIKNENLGTFRGLIVADDIVHLHATVIGAIISITPSPSEGSTIGNGSGNVLFSRKALINGIGEIINAANFGFAKNRIAISYWYE